MAVNEKKQRYYTVIAGNHKPQPQLQGFLKKSDGQPAPGAQEIMIEVGMIQIPNYSLLWAKRVISNPSEASKKKDGDRSVSLTDPLYRGELEFLTYGDDGGEAIECRFLPNAKSLDKQFQDTILKLKMRDEDATIDLKNGFNDFDYTTEPVLIQFLKVHARNSDSKSKNPDIKESDYMDYNPSKVMMAERNQLALQQTALNLVFGVDGNDDKITILATILGKDSSSQPEILLNEMLADAKNHPDVLVGRYEKMREETRELLVNSVDMKLLDDGVDGMLSFFEKGRKLPLITNIESSYKGKAMLKYVVDSLLDPEVFNAVRRLKASYESSMSTV